jgi:hypothetical protein
VPLELPNTVSINRPCGVVVSHQGSPSDLNWEMDGTAEAQPFKPEITPEGLSMRVDLPALIDAVYVSPTAPDWFTKVVEAMTLKCGFQFPVRQSALAAAPLF